jgi:hypothetical protein
VEDFDPAAQPIEVLDGRKGDVHLMGRLLPNAGIGKFRIFAIRTLGDTIAIRGAFWQPNRRRLCRSALVAD